MGKKKKQQHVVIDGEKGERVVIERDIERHIFKKDEGWSDPVCLRAHAMNCATQRFSGKSVEDTIRDAALIETYFRDGTVPSSPAVAGNGITDAEVTE